MTIDTAIQEAVQRAVAPLVREIQELSKRIAPPAEWRSLPDAADHYGVTPGTVRRWIAEGRIEAKGSGKARKVRV